MAGVGIQGRVEATVERKGRSLWWLLPPAIAVVLLVIFGPHLLMKGTQFGIKRAMTKLFGSAATNPASAIKVQPAIAQTQVAPTVQIQPSQVGVTSSSGTTAGCNMSGYMRLPDGSWFIAFSDGTSILSTDQRLQRLTPQYCIVDGVLHWLAGEVGARPSEPKPAAPVESRAEAASVSNSASPDIHQTYRVRFAPAHGTVASGTDGVPR
jgi:hypothetical protein